MVGVSRGTWVIPVMKSLASMVVLCRRCWILSRIFLKFMQFVLADGCAVFVWVSVELLGACHLVLCFPGSFSMFHVKRKFGGCGMWELFHVEHLSYLFLWLAMVMVNG